MPCRAGVRPSAPGMKTSTVLFDPALMMSRVEMTRKMAISMDAQDDPGPGAERDAAVQQPPGQQAAGDGQDGPHLGELDAQVGRDEDRAEEPEAAEQERGDQGLGQGECPAHQPAEEGSQPAADVGVHAARRGQVAGQLAKRSRR